MGLSTYDPANMVTAVTSGLENYEFLCAARDAGIRRLVCDTSNPGWDSPAPNMAIANPHQPAIVCIPRRPTNLFYDISTPAEWVSKYNALHRAYWGRELTIAEIVEQEADVILRYLLKFEVNPLMFHQANLRAYDGQHSLLGDLFNRVLARYNAVYNSTPIICPAMEEIAALMQQRAAYNAATIEATLIIGQGLTLRSDRALTIPITGLYAAGQSESCAGQWIAHIPVSAGIPQQLSRVCAEGWESFEPPAPADGRTPTTPFCSNLNCF
ncbi:MAG: hypothetical protein R2911_01425 [Caldilineaceae bacterium]